MLGVDKEGTINESNAALDDLRRQGAGRNMILSQLLTDKAVTLLKAAARGQEVPATTGTDGASDPKETAAETPAEESREADSAA